MRTAYSIGHLGFTIDGSSPFLDSIREELSPVLADVQSTAPGLSFHYQDTDPPQTASIAKPVTSWADGFITERDAIRYSYAHTPTHSEVCVNLKRPSTRVQLHPKWLRKARHWNHLSFEEDAAKTFMYDIFDYITQIHGLSVGQTYIHASSFSKNNEGVAIFAWGGVGKTTSMLKMVIDEGWSFLSDDLGIVDSAGYLWRSPKHMQIYGYNLVGQTRLTNRFMSNRTLLDKISWFYRSARFGKNRVRRRVSAESLFGNDNVATNARLTSSIFAARVKSGSLSFTAISPDELARRAAAILINEINPFSQIVSALAASGHHSVLPDVETLRAQTAEIIKAAVGETKPVLWTIPQQTSPDEMFHSLKTFLGDTNNI